MAKIKNKQIYLDKYWKIKARKVTDNNYTEVKQIEDLSSLFIDLLTDYSELESIAISIKNKLKYL